jgi:hypothetical protein
MKLALACGVALGLGLWAVPDVAAAAPKVEDPNGTPVRITASTINTTIFIAKGDVPSNPLVDTYERVGVAPLTIKLAPGVYSIESSTPTASMGYTRFDVEQNKPIDIDVRNGDAMVRTIGDVLVALGVSSIVLGVLAATAISPHDSTYARWAISIPLLGAGAGSTIVGIGMIAAGSTTFKMPVSAEQARLWGVTLRF